MAPTISNINLSKLMAFTQNIQAITTPSASSRLAKTDESITLTALHDPTALILKSAMQKINDMFAPHLGDGALQQALDSAQDMSPKATAERILSFATHIIGQAENQQADLPIEEQRSRERLFNNIQTGIEKGFEQARNILEGMQALDGEVKDTVDSTYTYVQQGLERLAALLQLTPPQSTKV